jgi:hypothetical protein
MYLLVVHKGKKMSDERQKEKKKKTGVHTDAAYIGVNRKLISTKSTARRLSRVIILSVVMYS